MIDNAQNMDEGIQVRKQAFACFRIKVDVSPSRRTVRRNLTFGGTAAIVVYCTEQPERNCKEKKGERMACEDRWSNFEKLWNQSHEYTQRTTQHMKRSLECNSLERRRERITKTITPPMLILVWFKHFGVGDAAQRM